MRTLSPEQIETYADAAGEAVLSNVGGYQLEKLGVHLFEAIDGDHTTVLGLPMLKLLRWLRGSGMVRV
jgi:septum formation protein